MWQYNIKCRQPYSRPGRIRITVFSNQCIMFWRCYRCYQYYCSGWCGSLYLCLDWCRCECKCRGPIRFNCRHLFRHRYRCQWLFHRFNAGNNCTTCRSCNRFTFISNQCIMFWRCYRCYQYYCSGWCGSLYLCLDWCRCECKCRGPIRFNCRHLFRHRYRCQWLCHLFIGHNHFTTCSNYNKQYQLKHPGLFR